MTFSPDVAALVTGLGLGTLAPGLAGTLDTLGTGRFKSRVTTFREFIGPLNLYKF